MTQALPRLARKDVRTIADEFITAGWVYEGDDSHGHARFAHPCGDRFALPETPRGRLWMLRARDAMAKAAGARRGSFDRGKQRQRRGHHKQTFEQQIRNAAAERAAIIYRREADAAREQARRRLEQRWREMKDLSRLMGGYSPI